MCYKMEERYEKYWRDFLKEKNLPDGTEFSDVFCFGDDDTADMLLALVLNGKKRATSSARIAYEIENEALPQVGEYSIVTDSAGEPKCVITDTAVTVYRFCDMNFDIIKKEGEDECLETWQSNHRGVFTDEGRELGYEFSEDMEIVFEEFEVLYQ